MDTNLPVWKYYEKGYVHPDFVPYLRENVPVGDRRFVASNDLKLTSLSKEVGPRYANVNTWLREAPSNLVNDSLVRKGWGMAFIRQHAGDPCPTGFDSAPGGYCVERKKDHVPVFYSEEAFLAKNQFWDSYGSDVPRISQSTDMRSVNPLTGEYTVYFHSKGVNDSRYRKMPSKDCFLG
jgi:hypothetical protein